MEKITKKIIRKIAGKLGFETIGDTPNFFERAFVSLKPKKESRGNVLLSYVNGLKKDGFKPFLSNDGESIPDSHTNYWESLQIAKTFLNLNYSVDVIHYYNKRFVPEKDYSFFVGARTNFAEISKNLNEDCVKIVHLDTAHWVFNNHSSYKRLLDLQQRKGATVTTSDKMVDKNLAIEYADYATMLGNRFTISTYSYAGKPVFPIPISTCFMYPWPENKDFESCRKNYLWFGSSAMVHKGLDLVLDAFADMPDYHLTICGPVKGEKDFETLFYKELYQLPNIDTVDWVDVKSQEFIDIMNNCVGLIYPSCSEGQSGAVVSCLHAGLIPVISRESGVDVEGFSSPMQDCTIKGIKDAVTRVSSFPAEELKATARLVWKYARANHTRERFAQEYNKTVIKIITDRENNYNTDKVYGLMA